MKQSRSGTTAKGDIYPEVCQVTTVLIGACTEQVDSRSSDKKNNRFICFIMIKCVINSIFSFSIGKLSAISTPKVNLASEITYHGLCMDSK